MTHTSVAETKPPVIRRKRAVTLYLPDDLLEALRDKAFQERSSMSVLVETAVAAVWPEILAEPKE